LNVLQACRYAGVERVIHTSTSEVYGTARTVPIAEDHPLQGQSPYSASKIGADKMAEAMHLSFQLPVVTIRPFNTYGPRQSDRAVIPTIIGQCLAGADTIRLGSLHPTRDLTFVEDTARAFVQSAVADDVVGRTINLGTGREISIGDLARLIADEAGVRAAVTTDSVRVRPAGSEVDRLVADTSLARSLLGWEPRVSLRDGLRRTIEWARTNLEHYRPAEYVV
jgi:nucleoside-diphosphate-sugar epimerase